MKQQTKGTLYLLATTVIWGTAFVAQSMGMDHIGPLTFQTARSLIAVAVLVPAVWVTDRSGFLNKWASRGLWRSGFWCGIALFVAANLQQIGLCYTDAGKAGFITSMYIVLVPVLGMLLGQKCGRLIWVSVALAVVGLYLLSYTGVGGVQIGDLCLLGSAAAYAVQITLVDRLGKGLDGVRLNVVQILVNGILSAAAMLLFEEPQWTALASCIGPLLYTGVVSSGIAYTLQILGQQWVDPAPASLIMSLESVVAVLSGWLVLHETLTGPELLGCVLVFAGVVLAQKK